MTIAVLLSGTETALADRSSSQQCASPQHNLATMSDLLDALAKNPPPELAMLRSTCTRFAAFMNEDPIKISIDSIYDNRSGFRPHLEACKYKEASVRSYVNYVRILLEHAKSRGWRPHSAVHESWRAVMEIAKVRRCSMIATDLMRIRTDPRDVTVDDVDNWLLTNTQKGRAYPYTHSKTTHFWRILRECGCTEQNPMCFVREQQYGIPLRMFPSRLKSEVTELLRWKSAEYSLDRPKNGRHRAISSYQLQQTFSTLLGYVMNVRKEHDGSEIVTIEDLVRRETVGGYVEWNINERKVKGGPLQRKFGRLWSALRHHPKYRSLDWGWLRRLADGIPIEHDSEIRKRKAAKFLEYSALESVVEHIHSERSSAEKKNEKHAALLCMEELLMRWLITLPWRQRNIRELRLGGSKPNLFRRTIPPFSAVDKPKWVVELERENPLAEFWQFAFSVDETKTKIPVHALVPHQLIPALEEYLTKWRSVLVAKDDPGTLFVNSDGGRMSQLDMTNTVSRLTLRYGGRRVTPHLFRDIVAFTWLKEHPQDFLTLSKLLWHSNVNTTIRIYGGRFNESSGVCAMEAWLDRRSAKVSDDQGYLTNIKPPYRAGNVWSNHA